MKLFDLGVRPWLETQLIYHALAYLGIEGLVIQKTSDPYMCLGLFNNPLEELDLDYMAREQIPFFRREIGGGTVWLDCDQIFYHLIIHRDNPICPVNNRIFFKKFLEPVINTYRDLGLEARYVPPNDLVIGGRKISGNGAGLINDFKILSGSIILDFNFSMMARCIKAPDEEFRENFYRLMKENITTLKNEIGIISEEEIKARLIGNFKNELGVIEDSPVSGEILSKMEELKNEKFTKGWLYSPGKWQKGTQLKVIEGLYQFKLEFNSMDISGTRDNHRIKSVRIMKDGKQLSEPESMQIIQGLEKEIFNILLRTA